MVTYETANDSAHVEDSPEHGEVSALLLLVWVGDHDGTLSSP